MTGPRPVVIDAVTHAFDSRPSNHKSGAFAERALESFFQFQWSFLPDPYRLERELYFRAIDAETLASVLFLESGTDFAVYHTIPAWGVFEDLSPIDVGLTMRERHPGRVFVYAAVSPLEGARAIEELERQVEEWDVIGLKLYPMDIIDGRMIPMRMSDEKLAYPVFERCRELGIKTIAVHKAIPLDQSPAEYYRTDDVDYCARDFPDLNFEIVHGGFAFLEETALQMARFPNVYINLEGIGAMLTRQPRSFARILGELTVYAGHERILWGTGAMAFHPQPLLEAFERFQMPEDLVEGHGYLEFTDAVKADILGGNFARLHGLDLDSLTAAVAGDDVARARAAGRAEAWQVLRNAVSSGAG
jgi:predicted TIM-barrel fold metal-dependent hydrolase